MFCEFCENNTIRPQRSKFYANLLLIVTFWTNPLNTCITRIRENIKKKTSQPTIKKMRNLLYEKHSYNAYIMYQRKHENKMKMGDLSEFSCDFIGSKPHEEAT